MSAVWMPETFRDRPFAREHFSRMVSWAASEHPFYQKFCPDPATHVPILSRTVFTDHNDLLLNGREETGRTSGSTGIPVRVAWSPEKDWTEQRAARQFLEWAGPALKRIRLVSAREAKPGECWMDICEPVAAQMAFVLEHTAGQANMALVTYPSNAVQLAEALVAAGRQVPALARLVCYAESFDEEDEPLLGQAFPNAKIWNNYSCSEVGGIALRCPHEPDFMHVLARHVGVEVLGDDDLPVADGERGRLVVTDYVNRWTPFIRYDLGDLAVAGQCPCGQIPYPSLRRVLGKVRGFLRDRDGNKRIFANIGARLKHVEGLRQYQIIQAQLDHLTVRYVPGNNVDQTALEQRLADELEAFLGFRPGMEFQPEAGIEREANGKFYATICRV